MSGSRITGEEMADSGNRAFRILLAEDDPTN